MEHNLLKYKPSPEGIFWVFDRLTPLSKQKKSLETRLPKDVWVPTPYTPSRKGEVFLYQFFHCSGRSRTTAKLTDENVLIKDSPMMRHREFCSSTRFAYAFKGKRYSFIGWVKQGWCSIISNLFTSLRSLSFSILIQWYAKLNNGSK